MQTSAAFEGGSTAIFAQWPDGPPTYYSPYYSTFAFDIGDSLTYEEGWSPSMWGVNTCDEGTWNQASTVTLQVTDGANLAQFYNYNTRVGLGNSVTGTITQIRDNYQLVADGTIPASGGNYVTVLATSGGIAKTDTIKVKPYFFNVSTDSSRLDYGSGTPVRIRMTDVEGNEYYRLIVPFVRIRIADSVRYGTLWDGRPDSTRVWQMGDTLTNIASSATIDRYSGEEVRFYANEEQPRDSVRVGIAVEKTGEGYSMYYIPPNLRPYPGRDTVRGVTQVTVVVPIRKKVKIVDHSPWEIWPYLPPQINSNGTRESRGADRAMYNPKRTFSILVKDSQDSLLRNEKVSIFTKYEEGSGGHGHGGYADTGGTIRALPSMPDTLQGLFYRKGIGENSLTVITDEQGIAVVDSFIASQASGKFLVTARLVSDTTIMDTVNLQVKVPSLVDFRTGEYWNLTGTTSRIGRNHLSNHWCTQKMKDSLTKALKKFYEWTSGTEEEPKDPIRLGVNDMCLEWGGAFDIPGQWGFNEKHSFHRVGVSVDIDKSGMTTEQLDKLTDLMKNYGGIRNREKPQIHYGFDKGN